MWNMLYNSELVWTSYRHAYMARKTIFSPTVEGKSHTRGNYSNFLFFFKVTLEMLSWYLFWDITFKFFNPKGSYIVHPTKDMWVWKSWLPVRHYAKSWKHLPNFRPISKKRRDLVVCMGAGDGTWVGGTGQGSRQLWWPIWESKVKEGFCYFWLFPCIFIMELQMEGIRKEFVSMSMSHYSSYQFVWKCGCFYEWNRSPSFILAVIISWQMQNSKGGRPSWVDRIVSVWAHWLECPEHSSQGWHQGLCPH